MTFQVFLQHIMPIILVLRTIILLSSADVDLAVDRPFHEKKRLSHAARSAWPQELGKTKTARRIMSFYLESCESY